MKYILMVFYLAIVLISGWVPIPKILSDTRHSILVLALVIGLYSLFKDRKFFNTLISHKGFPTFVSIFFLIAYVKYAWFEYASFNINAIDFSLIDLMIPHTQKGQFMYSPVCDCNHFGIHTNYILFLFHPFYLLFKSPLFALFLHPLTVFISIFPLRWICKHFNMSDTYTNLIHFSFLTLSSTMFILKYQFHLEVFYLPFFFALIFYFLEGRYYWAFLFLLLSISIKEDAAFYLIPFFSYFILSRKKRSFSLTSIFLLLTSIYINFKMVLPANQGGENYKMIGAVSKYGSTIEDLVLYIVENPLSVFKNIFLSGTKSHLLPFLFIPLFSPITFLPIMAFAIIHAMAGNDKMFNVGLYYSAPLLPFLYLGFIHFLYRYKAKKNLTHFGITFLLIYGSFIGSGYLKYRNYGSNLNNFKKINQSELSLKTGCIQASIIPHINYDTTSYLLNKDCLKREPDYIILNEKISLYPHSENELSTLKTTIKMEDYRKQKFGDFELYKRITK